MGKKAPYPRRFADLEVGQVLTNWQKKQNGEWAQHGNYLVTDSWFNPVAGQDDPISGTMVAVALFQEKDGVVGRKWAYPIRGLASAGFHYEGVDPAGPATTDIAKRKKRSAADAIFEARDGMKK